MSSAVNTQATAEQAMVRIFQSSSKERWADIKAEGGYKIIAVCRFIWQSVFGIDCQRALLDLVKTVSKETITDIDGKGVTITSIDANDVAKRRVESEKKLATFYAAFQKRVKQLNISETSGCFPVYLQAAKMAIADPNLVLKKKVDALTIKKLGRLDNPFLEMMYGSMIKAAASTSTDIEGYAKSAENLAKAFKKHTKAVETSLRQAILSGRGKDCFKTQIEAFEKRGAGSKHAAFRAETEEKLKGEQTKLKARVDELDGERLHDEKSKLHITYLESEKLKVEKEDQRKKLSEKFPGISATMSEEEIAALSDMGDFNTFRQAYLDASKKYKAAWDKHLELVDERNKAAARLGLLTGLLSEDGLNDAANLYAQGNAAFLKELQEPVLSGDVMGIGSNVDGRFGAMDEILKLYKQRS